MNGGPVISETIKERLIFGKFNDEIYVLPFQFVEHTIKCWNTIGDLEDSGVSFYEAAKVFDEIEPVLSKYFIEIAKSNEDGNPFSMPEDYFFYTDFASDRNMLTTLPEDMISSFVEINFSANGEKLVSINKSREQELNEFCRQHGYTIFEDQNLLEKYFNN